MLSPTLPALGVLLAVFLPQAVALARIDGREHRLPNPRVALLTATTTAGLVLAAVLWPALRPLLRAGLVLALVCAVGAITVALLAPQLIGMGDAKTLPVVVLMATALGPHALIAALLGIALLGGAAGLAVWVVTRSAASRFAFGPVLLAGPFAGLIGAPAVAAALGTAT